MPWGSSHDLLGAIHKSYFDFLPGIGIQVPPGLYVAEPRLQDESEGAVERPVVDGPVGEGQEGPPEGPRVAGVIGVAKHVGVEGHGDDDVVGVLAGVGEVVRVLDEHPDDAEEFGWRKGGAGP